MSFIRPEVAARLHKGRELLACLAVLAVGLWMTQSPGPVVKAVGALAVVASVGFGAIAWRRLRFVADDSAPGVVSVDERQITYLGPVVGGAMGLDALMVLRLRREGARRAWLLQGEDGTALAIPHGAAGEEQLFDAFAALPGFRMAHVLQQLETGPDGSFIVWQRTMSGTAPRLTSRTQRDTS
ncbi:hypothetical protein PVW48_08225 [Dinoroseobacter sp. PD6]|uniref:hypothetical protein n=1 Tax=Dinoroseobacter sp. PD6 TaxID=3028384 RepID=UPI00237A1B08|nr:hypothetical protein [Dinoroseobacter sp. PD6]MDD9716725.1 hypothetical protein [Dinoroseobacter sp. PD6]